MTQSNHDHQSVQSKEQKSPRSNSTETKIIEERRAKAEEMRAQGQNPFANDFKVTHVASQLTSQFAELSTEELDHRLVEKAGQCEEGH